MANDRQMRFGYPNGYPNVTIKLGLVKEAEDSLFRRISHDQLVGSIDPIKKLKTLAVQLSLGGLAEPERIIDLRGYSVTLTYTDSDGDKVLIHSREDLIAAMREVSVVETAVTKKLKVLAHVQTKPPQPSRGPLTESSTQTAQPSQTTQSTQTTTTTTQHENPRPLPLQDAVESIVGVAAAALHAVQSQVLQEARRVETRRSVVTEKPQTAEPPKVNKDVSMSIDAPKREESSEAVKKEETSEVPKVEDTSHAPESEEMTPASVEDESPKPFVHGRHTCDGCLTTPIVGKRFHAVNLPDYDLCETCNTNYKGSEIKFEEVELDRDRAFQERWQRRFARMSSRPHAGRSTGLRRGPYRRSGGRGNPWAPRYPGRCGPFGPPNGPPPPPFTSPNGPPPPFAPPHGPPPPFAPPCGKPVHGPPNGPPPPLFGCPPPPFFAEQLNAAKEADLALKEAIRRSMEDVKKTEEEVEEKSEDKIYVKSGDKIDVNPTEEKDAKSEEKTDFQLAEGTNANSEEKTDVQPAEETNASLEGKSQAGTEETCGDLKTAESSKNGPFASDAEGYGDVAAGLGEALDKVANAIDEMNLELNRTSSNCKVEENSVEEPEIILDAVCTVVNNDTPEDTGAMILDGEAEDASHNSWQVVSEEEDQIAQDEALARAAQVVGSALFNSDMGRSHENVSTLSSRSSSSSSSSSSTSSDSDVISSVLSVPTTVPSLGGPGPVPPAQLERWAIQLQQLHELGFYNDSSNVEVLERLNAANIGVDSTDEVTVRQVINEMMKDW